MELADLPRFTVTAIHPNCCTGQFDLSSWVGEAWIAALYVGGGQFLWGRFRDIDVAARTCCFYPDQGAELSVLRAGDSYAFMDGYWGERAELVLDEGRHWQRVPFEPSNMVVFPAAGGGWIGSRSSSEAPSGGEVVSGGWDHEHCGICGKTIGRGGEPVGFFSSPNSWVCEECYTSFVAQRSLAFVSQA